MSNTQLVLTLPERRAGLSFTTSSTGWAYTKWQPITDRTNSPINIIGLQFQVTKATTADTTYEVIFEIGIGNSGSEVTKIQIPYSFRSDTAVAYYLDTRTIFLPEAFSVSEMSRISVRLAQSVAFGDTYNGIKLMYTSDKQLIDNSTNIPQNYQFVKADSGMSVTEKIR